MRHSSLDFDFCPHAGLLDVIAAVLSERSDAELKQIIGYIVKPTPLIVMANHWSSRVRTAVIQVRAMSTSSGAP